MIQVFLRERAAFGLVALGVGALVERGHPFLGAIQLAGAEAELARALGLDRDGGEPFGDLAALHVRAERHRLDVLAQRSAVHPGAEELGVGPSRQFVEPIVQHLLEESLHQFAPVIGDRASTAPRPLAHERHR